MRVADRRNGIRFPLKLNCRVVFPFKARCNFEGITENLSRDNVLIRVPRERIRGTPLRVGDWVRIMLDLPGTASLPSRCLGCEATLARVEEDGPEAVHLAFQIDQMEFCESESGGAAGRARISQIALSGLAT